VVSILGCPRVGDRWRFGHEPLNSCGVKVATRRGLSVAESSESVAARHPLKWRTSEGLSTVFGCQSDGMPQQDGGEPYESERSSSTEVR
jgi:hypothetical protein